MANRKPQTDRKTGKPKTARRASRARTGNVTRAPTQGENRMSDSLKDYVTTREAAEMLGIRIESVIQLCNDRRLDSEKVGNSWIIRKDSVEEYYRTKARSGHPTTNKPKLAAAPK